MDKNIPGVNEVEPENTRQRDESSPRRAVGQSSNDNENIKNNEVELQTQAW